MRDFDEFCEKSNCPLIRPGSLQEWASREEMDNDIKCPYCENCTLYDNAIEFLREKEEAEEI